MQIRDPDRKACLLDTVGVSYPAPAPPRPLWGNVSAPGARRASFVTRALPVDCCR